jgi:repressor LexA
MFGNNTAVREEELTRRQRDVLAFLQRNADRFAHPPTLDELCKAMGLASRGSLHKHIQALIAAGLIEPLAQKQRGLRLARVARAPRNEIPFHGYVAGGRPIDAVPAGERVVVESREHARNGETVVALIDNAQATLKRIEQRPGKVILQPANAAMAPIEFAAERVRIQGAVIGLMRRF